MCIAHIVLVSRTTSYEEDDTPKLLDFVKEATLIPEANATFTQERAHCATQSKLCSNGNSLSSCACWIVPSRAPVEISLKTTFLALPRLSYI